MFELASWLAPALALVLTLAGFAVTDRPDLYIQVSSVPRGVSESGYTNRVIVERLQSRLNEVRIIGHSEVPGFNAVSDYADTTVIQALATNVSLEGLLRSMQRSVGLIKVYVHGYMVQSGDRAHMHLSVERDSGEREELHLASNVTRVDELVRQMADQLMATTDPYTYCLYLYRSNILTRDFDELNVILADQLVHADDAARPFFHNLAAMRAFATGQDDEAIRHLHIAIDTSSNPTLFNFNLALIHLRRERHAEAIPLLERVISRAVRADVNQLARVTLARALLDTGRIEEAITVARQVHITPEEPREIQHEFSALARRLRERAGAELVVPPIRQPSGPSLFHTELLLSLFLVWDRTWDQRGPSSPYGARPRTTPP